MEHEKRTERQGRETPSAVKPCTGLVICPLRPNPWLVLMLPGIGKKQKKKIKTRPECLISNSSFNSPKVNRCTLREENQEWCWLLHIFIIEVQKREREVWKEGWSVHVCLFTSSLKGGRGQWDTKSTLKEEWGGLRAKQTHGFPGKKNSAKQTKLQPALHWTHRPTP